MREIATPEPIPGEIQPDTPGLFGHPKGLTPEIKKLMGKVH